jgi:hypothetical protein
MGFDWANKNRDRVQGIVYMEAIVTPLTWANWPENARRVFQGFRSESGEEMSQARRGAKWKREVALVQGILAYCVWGCEPIGAALCANWH